MNLDCSGASGIAWTGERKPFPDKKQQRYFEMTRFEEIFENEIEIEMTSFEEIFEIENGMKL
jgi:hypothetical protein